MAVALTVRVYPLCIVRTVADTLGPASLVNPDGYVGIPRTAWSSLYFDIQELLTTPSGDHTLTSVMLPSITFH